MVLVRDMPHIGKAACDRHLPGARQVEMAEAAHIAGKQHRLAFNDVHDFNPKVSQSNVAPDAFTIAVHFGISALM